MTGEAFTVTRYAAGLVPAELATPGLLHSIKVPSGKRQRFVWIAAGAFYQNAVTDCWFVLGKLTFRRRGSPVGVYDFSDASGFLTEAERLDAPRQITRLKPNGNGSQQPSLQFREAIPGVTPDRDNLDLACFAFTLDCDQIDYEIEKTYSNVPAAALNIVLGFKVLSI